MSEERFIEDVVWQVDDISKEIKQQQEGIEKLKKTYEQESVKATLFEYVRSAISAHKKKTETAIDVESATRDDPNTAL